MMRVFVPRDAAALALGADRVASALRNEAGMRGVTLEIIRTGSRGAVWLEPLVELETPTGRIGYGPIAIDDVAGLLDAWVYEGGAHSLCLGRLEDHPWFAGQHRLTFARCGVIDPVSVADFRAHGGFCGA